MRRLRQRPTPGILQSKEQMPLAESIIPLDKRGLRNWAAMNDGEVVAHTQKVMREQGVATRGELAKADGGLYEVLRKRKLLDKAGFEAKRHKKRNWASMSDEDIVELAKKVMKEKGIGARAKLQKADVGLYNILSRRKLLDRVGLEEKRRKPRKWASISDDELIEFTKRLMGEREIKRKRELQKADFGLHGILYKRKLLDRVGFEEKGQKRREWASMSDDEIVDHAKKFMEERGLRRRRELEKVDSGLYSILCKRKLLDRVGFEDKRRDWTSMSDDELAGFAKNFMEEKRIRSKAELREVDQGLYLVLRKRKLFGVIGFERKHRDWASMSDDEIVEFTRKLMKERGIGTRTELKKEDGGLHDSLIRRNLLPRVFAPLEAARNTEAVQQVFDGLKEFGDSE